jgi:CopG antitoxin of type II toxin-antitoxin system
MVMNKPLKKLPVLMTDEEAERFIDEPDLSEYDLSGFRRMKFELVKNGADGEAVATAAQEGQDN